MKLAKSRLHTQRRHLDQKLALLRPLGNVPRPPSGWIQAIREALGITTRQMGKHLGMSGAAITKMENRERSGGITLNDLERAASILQCRVAYTLIPLESLEQTLRDQATKAAERLGAKADHAMRLEEQQVHSAEMRAQKEVLAKLLMENLDPRLWDVPEKKAVKK